MLLDEAAGVKKNEQPILPVGVQQGRAEVASWNKKKVSLNPPPTHALRHYTFTAVIYTCTASLLHLSLLPVSDCRTL